MRLTRPSILIVLPAAAVLSLFSQAALGWNTQPMEIEALRIVGNGHPKGLGVGAILFTLKAHEGYSCPGEAPSCEFRCFPEDAMEAGESPPGGDPVWFVIHPCEPADDLQCIASVNRMASALIAAKLATRKIYVHRGTEPEHRCDVSEIALKP